MWFSNQVPFMFPKSQDDRVSNPKHQKGRHTSSPTKKETCTKCGKKYYGDFLKEIDNCFGCGKSWQKVRDCPNFKGQDKESWQESCSNEALKKKHFYDLRSRVKNKLIPMW